MTAPGAAAGQRWTLRAVLADLWRARLIVLGLVVLAGAIPLLVPPAAPSSTPALRGTVLVKIGGKPHAQLLIEGAKRVQGRLERFRADGLEHVVPFRDGRGGVIEIAFRRADGDPARLRASLLAAVAELERAHAELAGALFERSPKAALGFAPTEMLGEPRIGRDDASARAAAARSLWPATAALGFAAAAVLACTRGRATADTGRPSSAGARVRTGAARPRRGRSRARDGRTRLTWRAGALHAEVAAPVRVLWRFKPLVVVVVAVALAAALLVQTLGSAVKEVVYEGGVVMAMGGQLHPGTPFFPVETLEATADRLLAVYGEHGLATVEPVATSAGEATRFRLVFRRPADEHSRATLAAVMDDAPRALAARHAALLDTWSALPVPLKPPLLQTAVVEREDPAPARQASASARALLLGVLATGIAVVALWLVGIEIGGARSHER